jgi:small subunit ribosomal protein S21
MTEVTVKGNLDGALKKFKQKCARDGVLSEAKKRKFYDKPGVKRREEKKQNIINSRKRNKRNNRSRND